MQEWAQLLNNTQTVIFIENILGINLQQFNITGTTPQLIIDRIDDVINNFGISLLNSFNVTSNSTTTFLVLNTSMNAIIYIPEFIINVDSVILYESELTFVNVHIDFDNEFTNDLYFNYTITYEQLEDMFIAVFG